MNNWHSSLLVLLTLGCGSATKGDPTSSSGEPQATGGVAGGAESSGGTAGANQTITICDGTLNYRLQYYVAATVDSVSTFIQIRNGVQFLHVRGDCTYFVQDGDSILDPVMTGRLSEQEAAQLAQDLRLNDFEQLDGTISMTPGAHQPRSVIAWSGYFVGCDFDCRYGAYNNPTDQAAHEVLTPIFDQLLDWRTVLKERGTPLVGDVRVALVRWQTDNWTLPTVDWPLTRSPLEFEIPFNEFRSDVTIVSGADARALLDLRNSVTEQGLYFTIEFEGNWYDVTVDEVLPGENEQGTVLPDL